MQPAGTTGAAVANRPGDVDQRHCRNLILVHTNTRTARSAATAATIATIATRTAVATIAGGRVAASAEA
jgi:hypothetical protein